MSKNKIRAIAITAVICLAAGAGVFKIFVSKQDTSINTKINVSNSDIISSSDKNNDNKDSKTVSKEAETSNSKSNEKSDNGNTAKDDNSGSGNTEVTAVAPDTEKTNDTDNTNSNEASDLKNEYLAKLAEIEEQDKACGLDSAKTTTDMKIAQGKRYTLWDDELNVIYTELKSKLSKDEMSKLEKEELSWIHVKDANAVKKAAQYKGGTFESVAKSESLVNDTKERCYYLVNNYM